MRSSVSLRSPVSPPAPAASPRPANRSPDWSAMADALRFQVRHAGGNEVADRAHLILAEPAPARDQHDGGRGRLHVVLEQLLLGHVQQHPRRLHPLDRADGAGQLPLGGAFRVQILDKVSLAHAGALSKIS